MSEAPVIVFDEGAHVYKVNDRVVPSVTQIIYAAGLVDDTWFTDEARNRGRIVHTASHYLDENDLVLDSLDEKYRPYLSAWERFKREARFTPDLIEHRIYHKVWGYCGTLDRTGTFDGGTKCILDLKTSGSKSGTPEKWWPLQLSAYISALDIPDPGAYRRMNVSLHKDGTFRVHEYPNGQYRDAWNMFLACLSIWNYHH